MKRRSLLISLLGGIILMSTINGCTNNTKNNTAQPNQTSTSSSGVNRSPEQAALEGSFQPLFDFLAEEKKDFSGLKEYYSSLSVTETSEFKDVESYTLDLNREGDSFSGTYTVMVEGQETVYPVAVDGENNVQFTNQTPPEGLNPFLFQTISQKEIKELSIFDYTANHPETELKDISYRLLRTHSLITAIQNQYKVNPKKDSLLTVTWRGGRDYRTQYGVEDKQHLYIVTTGVEFE